VEGWLEGSDAVAREEESVQAGEVREVCESGNVVVGEVDCVVVLQQSRPSVIPILYTTAESTLRNGDVGGRWMSIPLRHPSSQWQVFCGLCVICCKLLSLVKCSICSSRKRTSEVELALFERV